MWHPSYIVSGQNSHSLSYRYHCHRRDSLDGHRTGGLYIHTHWFPGIQTTVAQINTNSDTTTAFRFCDAWQYEAKFEESIPGTESLVTCRRLTSATITADGDNDLPTFNFQGSLKPRVDALRLTPRTPTPCPVPRPGPFIIRDRPPGTDRRPDPSWVKRSTTFLLATTV